MAHAVPQQVCSDAVAGTQLHINKQVLPYMLCPNIQVCMHLADTIASVPPEDYDDSDDDGHGDDEALVGRKIVKWE